MGPKILTLDIETAPLEVFSWGIHDQVIGIDQVITDWSILSFSAKWLDSPKVIYADTGGRGAAKVRDDSVLLQKLWDLLDEADILVVQNGKAFDLPRINARLLAGGFPPYSPVRIIDTLLVARRHFGFTSNKLAWLSKLVPKKKSEHKKYPGLALWLACLRDDKAAWNEMRKYNARDVESTELLYLKLRPWIAGHPNLSTYSYKTETACPKCGSAKIQCRGTTVTQTGRFYRFQCQSCGGWSQSKKSVTTTDKRKSLLGN